MGKYTQDAQQLLRLIGGKENIAAVSHCVTRMRFVLNDPSKADVEAIEAMKVVKGSFTQAGQFQVIIGNAVADFYNDFVKVAGVEGVSKDAVKQAAKKNQNVLQKVIAALAEIFAPLIPAIMAAFVLVNLERFFRKISPQVISSVVVPFCSLVLAVMAAHFIVGPIGWKIGSAISSVVYAGITGSFKVVFGAIFGFVYAPLVITGLHHMSNAIDLQLIADYGGTMLWPMIALSNIAQGSAVMGMIILQKKNVAAQEVNVPAGISCYLGVTEPGNLWCKPEIRIPVYLWNDRICYFSSCLRYDFYNSQRSRCRWNPGNPVHSAEIYGKLCNLYGDRFCDSDDTDIYCWKEKTFHGRSSGSRGQRRYSGCISRSRQHQRNRKYRNNRT